MKLWTLVLTFALNGLNVVQSLPADLASSDDNDVPLPKLKGQPVFKRRQDETGFVVRRLMSVSSNSLVIRTGAKPIGEYNPIDGLILAQRDCDPEVMGYKELNEMHAKLIQSATNRQINVFFTVLQGKEEGCRTRIGQFLGAPFTPQNYPNVTFLSLKTDDPDAPSIWTRDYTPQWMHTQDDQTVAVLPLAWGQFYGERALVHDYTQARKSIFKTVKLADTELANEGGNFIANDDGLCISSTAVLVNNHRTEEQMKEIYSAFYGCVETIFLEVLPYDSVKHSDMVTSFAKNNIILVGVYDIFDVDTNTLSVSLNNFDLIKNHPFVKQRNYEVVRVPMPPFCLPGTYDCVGKLIRKCRLFKTREDPRGCSLSSLSKCSQETFHKPAECADKYIYSNLPSYLNLLHMNDEVHIPIYNNYKKYEAEALEIIGRTTGKTIVTHVSDDLTTYGGSIHCVTKEIPKGHLLI